MKRESYTSAGMLPVKLLRAEEVRVKAQHGRIPPIHPQFIPTNRCNLRCEWCSCSAEDRELELSYPQATEIIDVLRALGARAVTITGGGEPMLHPYLPDLIQYFIRVGIRVGMVTNGTLLRRFDVNALNRVTWCRVSQGDGRPVTAQLINDLADASDACPDVDWAFSYVVGAEPDAGNAAKVVAIAQALRFTHVRFVSDLLDPANSAMGWLEDRLRAMGVSLDRVIFQDRQKYERGGPCWIGYLKPLVAADGRVYACCGAQYALAELTRNFPPELCLGDALDLPEIIRRSREPLDGSRCVRCYYGDYNRVLGGMLADVDHEEFV